MLFFLVSSKVSCRGLDMKLSPLPIAQRVSLIELLW